MWPLLGHYVCFLLTVIFDAVQNCIVGPGQTTLYDSMQDTQRTNFVSEYLIRYAGSICARPNSPWRYVKQWTVRQGVCLQQGYCNYCRVFAIADPPTLLHSREGAEAIDFATLSYTPQWTGMRSRRRLSQRYELPVQRKTWAAHCCPNLASSKIQILHLQPHFSCMR